MPPPVSGREVEPIPQPEIPDQVGDDVQEEDIPDQVGDDEEVVGDDEEVVGDDVQEEEIPDQVGDDEEVVRDDYTQEGPEQKKSRWWIPVVLAAILTLVIIALAAFIILAQVAPDFIDSLLYTPEELEIINY